MDKLGQVAATEFSERIGSFGRLPDVAIYGSERSPWVVSPPQSKLASHSAPLLRHDAACNFGAYLAYIDRQERFAASGPAFI